MWNSLSLFTSIPVLIPSSRNAFPHPLWSSVWLYSLLWPMKCEQKWWVSPSGRSFRSQCAFHHICCRWLQCKWSICQFGSQSDYNEQHEQSSSMSNKSISVVISHGDLGTACYYSIAHPILINTPHEHQLPVLAWQGETSRRKKEHVERLWGAKRPRSTCKMDWCADTEESDKRRGWKALSRRVL